ncbi:MAG: UDP-N-acetylglucosamine--N-acetylmuramyl-(pentapeptide) pyrophosphoryl-undecaprenol N-acetylglucosamine transferase [Deltaproteobacteria bacterium]|nr:UDP-N-acetylglucosamine--N-acetylmuramyl-(pentapeptide) pyrophosphoryl-undecaprenol N-acetylglucosamine transferase [Deltaproteobacteria bacterium]
MALREEKAKKGLRLVFAGGGTGGHLFPAIALAEEFRRRDPGIDITFMGGRGGLEEKVVPKYGYPLKVFRVEGLKRKKGLGRIRAVLKAASSTMEALRHFRSTRPDGVIGSGSYSSAPVVTAARLLGIKTAILEQNALPGLTNRVLGRFVDRVYISFEESRRYFPGGRTILSGNPVRREIARKLEDRRVADKFSILVFGGSQGATAVNAAFLDAIEFLTDIWSGLRIAHQTGKEGYDAVVAAYRRKNLKAEVSVFIEDMGAAYSSADLVVCRAGATSLAEITASARGNTDTASVSRRTTTRPSTRRLEKAGAADDKAGRLLERRWRRPKRLHHDRQAPGSCGRGRKLGRPRASQEIAEPS